jgi:putative ABC transport system permease protein
VNFVAIKMLMGDRAKYLGIVFGISLATLLIVHQVTIFTGLMARTWSVVRDLRDSSGVDLLVTDPSTEFLNDPKPMSGLALQRVRSVEGVEWAVPMSFTPVRARLDGGRFRTCIVVGLDDTTLLGGPARFSEGSVESLRKPDAVVVDRLDGVKLLSTREKGGGARPPRVGDVLEINDHRAVVAAVSDNTRPFLSQPILYTSMSNAARWAPPERRRLAYVLVRARAGEDVAALAERIEARTGLSAMSPTEFGFKTVGYFLRNTGIPVNFGITILLGCVVGVAISGQTFYLFVLDNLKQLAALKAMGASNRRLVGMTLLQAGMVGVVGYGLGVLGALGLILPFDGTELAFELYWQILAIAAAAIAGICVLVSVFSLNRVLRLEPAVVFKG